MPNPNPSESLKEKMDYEQQIHELERTAEEVSFLLNYEADQSKKYKYRLQLDEIDKLLDKLGSEK